MNSTKSRLFGTLEQRIGLERGSEIGAKIRRMVVDECGGDLEVAAGVLLISASGLAVQLGMPSREVAAAVVDLFTLPGEGRLN